MKDEELKQRKLGFQIKNTARDKRTSINTKNSKSDRWLKSEEVLTIKLNNCFLNINIKHKTLLG